MATMEKAPRIVRCPKCLALLQEPPPGTPLYKCGNCSTVLRAKHASADASGARRASARAPQLNRATPPIHADSNDARKLPSKPVPVDLTSRQANLDDPVDNRNRIGNPRLTPADTEKISPSHLHHHRISPPGPTPTYVPINSTNTYADNVFRTGQDHHRLVPRDPLASPSSRDEEGFLRGSRPTPIYLLQTKVPTPALVEKSPNYMHHNIQSPPSDQLRNPCDATDEKEGLADMRTRSSPGNVNVTIRQKSPPADLVAEGRARVCQGTPEVEADLTSFSPTKALAALRNAGPLDKVKRRHELGLGPTSKLPTCNAQGALTRGRNKSQGDESMVTENAESGPSTGLHRRQRSDGVAISERCAHENDLYVGNPALYAGRRWSVEDEVKAVDKFPEEPTSVPRVPGNERRALHNVEVTMEKEQCRDDPSIARVDEENVTPEEISIARASSSDISSQLNETTINASIPKTITIDQALGIQQNEPDLKATLQHKEKLVVSKDTFDDDEDDEPEALLGEDEERSPSTLSPRMSRKPLSPPHFLSSESAIGGVRPQSEHMSKSSYADQPRQESDAPSSLQDFHGLPDVLDYDTSEDSSNADDADPYQITSKPHSEELKSPTLSSHSGQVMLPDAAGVNSERSDDDDQEPTDTRSPNSQSQAHVGLIGSPYFASHRSPESIHSESPTPQTHTPDQLKQEPQGTAPESTSSFSFGQGGGQMQQGSAYSSLRGQTQKVRLEINTPVPERIHVRCGHCNLQLEVPPNLTRSETGVQKLRCGSCWRISRFRLNHLLLSHTSGVSSPAGSDRASPESSFQLGSSDGTTSGRYSGTRSNRETGTQERVVIRTGHNPRAASGSKLSNMVSVSTMSTPNTSGDLVTPIPKDMTLVDMSPSAEPSHATTSLSPTLSSISQQKTTASPDRRLLQSSSDSDEVEKASTTAQLKIGPTTFNNNPTRMTSWSAPEAGPEFDDGHEFKGLKGFLKKSVKELTKGKKSTQYRRKVVVNGHAVPDDVVRRAEEYAGGIHPGSYWYDFRAGFWGVMGGPCLGMILPSIEELNFPLARHCSHGKTGVLVNGRELHHRDLELLKKRGLPGTPGKAYNVDIDGRLTEETTGIELKGLGRLAPTLEQTGRGPGMWVPESQRG